jgi:hypothetical protein
LNFIFLSFSNLISISHHDPLFSKPEKWVRQIRLADFKSNERHFMRREKKLNSKVTREGNFDFSFIALEQRPLVQQTLPSLPLFPCRYSDATLSYAFPSLPHRPRPVSVKPSPSVAGAEDGPRRFIRVDFIPLV